MNGSLIFLIHVLAFLNLMAGVVPECKSPEQFNTECMAPYNNYTQGDTFWQNICSEAGRIIFECIKTQNDSCPTGNEEQTQLFAAFGERFRPFQMSIDTACKGINNESCQNFNQFTCFPSGISTFQGSTVLSFYEYFCGEQYLQHMFTCIGEHETYCPVSAHEMKVLFEITTPSGKLTYDDLVAKIPMECGKLLATDVDCITRSVTELAACDMDPSIDVPNGSFMCAQSNQTNTCVTKQCGSTVATFYDELFKFLQCWQNIDGSWSDWGPWGSCSVSCNGGTYVRSRACNNPPPALNGQDCEGNFIDIDGCNQEDCPVDGVFSLWGVWSECTKSCGGGNRERTRVCNSPPPSNGGRNCTGNVSDPQVCNEQICPVNGAYGDWSQWGQCTGTKNCGSGVRTRSRSCDRPPPSNGGSDCSGPSTEEEICYQKDCPVNGGFSDWRIWSACTQSCGGGTHTRTRSCDNPVPANGGFDCSGETSQSQTCNEETCPVTSCAEIADHYGTWQETLVGSTLTLQCKKAEEEGSYSRRCRVNGIWGNVTGQCDIKSEIFDEINKQLEELSKSENVSEEVEHIIKNLTDLTDSVDSTTSRETIERVVGTAKQIVSAVETNKAVTENGSESFFKLIDNIIKPETEAVWTDDESDVGGSDVFETVDRYLAVLQDVSCGDRSNGEVSVYENTYLYTEIGKVQGDVKYPNQKQSDSYIEISADTLSYKGVTDACFGGSSYTSIGNIVESNVLIDGSTTSFANGQEINSEVVAIQFPNVPDLAYSDLNPPVRVILKPINTNRTNPLCVFWDYSVTGSGRNGAWSSSGCELVNVTTDKVICECSHLTNFAVLMSPWKIPDKHSFILSIISAVGCAISMVCLIITIAIHALVWRLVRSDRAIILMNLCVALLLALGVFLAGINRTESQKACTAIAAIIQILFLAVFFFMLLIGIEILICVVHVFGTKFRIKILLPVAWLAPVVIVGISLGVTKAEGYGNDRFCWLDIDSGLIWSFIGPAAFVIFVNFIIVLVVFKKMASSSVLKSKSSLLKIQTGVRSLCVLLPLMGLTWVFGLLSVNSSFIFFPYLFCICNTLQGLFIFLFHCVFNRQVREALKRRQYRKRSLQTFSSDMRKQSRSLSKEMKTPTADLGSSESKKKGIDNRGYDRRYRRAKSEDYRPEDWDKFERKQHHKNIRRGSKLTA